MQEADTRLPDWAQQLKERYLSGEASQFLLHSNVGDLVRLQDEYIPLVEFLVRFLGRTKDCIVRYDLSEGLRFAEPQMKDKFVKRVNTLRMLRGEDEIRSLPADPSEVLPLLSDFLSLADQRGALIIDYLETIVPDSDIGFLSGADRANLVTLQSWSNDPSLLASDNIVILITENLSEVNRKVVNSPQLSTIAVGLPDRTERLDFLQFISERYTKSEVPLEQLAEITAGLTCFQIESLFKQAREKKDVVTFEVIREKKKEIIERECYGLVEFVESRHKFDAVGGLDAVKTILGGVSQAIRAGNTRQVPMGIMLVGPMGTGKTFLAEAFANESGLTCIKFKNFRDKWVGSTEANLERIINITQALGYVLLIIDEGDRSLGSDSGERDGGTQSRVIGRLKEFMSDTSHRGRIVFIVLTNRPDKLDSDLKRPGRLDMKLPLFFPQTAQDRVKIFTALIKKNDMASQVSDFAKAAERTEDFSGADLEAILFLADRLAMSAGRNEITDQDLSAAIDDFIPSRDTRMLEYMELLAVFECSSRGLLPKKHKQLTGDELSQLLRAKRPL